MRSNNDQDKSDRSLKFSEALKSISQDRIRTNLLRKQEQIALAFFGSLLVFASFILASYINKNYLLLGVPGFISNVFDTRKLLKIAYGMGKKDIK